MPKVVLPVRGLYKNGALWWIRTLRSPLTGKVTRASLGTSDTQRANRIAGMIADFAENPRKYEWLDKAVEGETSLDAIFTHHSAGTLHVLAGLLDAKTKTDDDLDEWVKTWKLAHLSTLDISERQKGIYVRQVRWFIPEGKKFVKSEFTEDYIQARLAQLVGARGDHSAKMGPSTKRSYIVGLQQFIEYARKPKRADFIDPLIDADWIPDRGSPRSTFHEYDTVEKVLACMAGEEKAAMALVYGTGIELGALLAMKGAHVGKPLPDGRGTIIAPGTKNEAREDRTIFVDAWAWKIFHAHAKTFTPRAPLWSWNDVNGGKELRDAFYRAQVAAGRIDEPPVNEETRKPLWGRVSPHTIHDARHSYCVNRSLGLDGEEPQDITFCSTQLGHADETMVMKIYKKANIKRRLELIKRQQVVKAAKAAGAK